MGDTTDGSSRAAHRAQFAEAEKEQGFLARLFGKTKAHSTNGAVQVNGRHNGQTALTPAQAGDIRRLNNIRVDDVAVPKAEIVAVSQKIKLQELVNIFRESGLTRLPVYKDTMDDPQGFVHLKDLALKYGFNGRDAKLDLKPLIRPLLFAPPSMPVGVLLQKMQAERRHLALVIDEFGGVDGLVTIEDLIEQVVGEIEDEHDIDEDQFWVKEKPGVYLIQPRTPVEDFEAEIGISLNHIDTDDEVETIGGLVFLLSGRVPVRGEVICHPDGTEFEIVDADARRIKRLRVCVPDTQVS